MAVRTALLLGVLGGMTEFASSSAVTTKDPTTDFAVLNEDEASRQPRILTVLTTYAKRTPLVKEYKEVLLDRQDGYHPAVSLPSRRLSDYTYDEFVHGAKVECHEGFPRAFLVMLASCSLVVP